MGGLLIISSKGRVEKSQGKPAQEWHPQGIHGIDPSAP